MTKLSLKITVFFLLSTLLLAACGGAAKQAAQGEPTALPPVVSGGDVIVDGRVVPNESVDLSFNTSGEVAEVLVEEGDLVKAGDVIARLGNREPLELTLANANLELLSAQQDLLSAEQGKQALFDNLPQAQTDALQALNTAREDFKDAERKVAGLRKEYSQADINEAKATLILAQDKLEKAQKDYKEYENSSEKNVIRAAMLNKLAQAQRDYDNALRRYNNILGGSTEFYRSKTQTEYDIAKARLAQTEKDYADLQAGPDPDELSLVEKKIATAQGRITAADAAVKSADAALGDLELLATINGTITMLDLIAGQRVSPGSTVAQLADFSQWFVETDNLTEIEVVDIATGQRANIIPDAAPDLTLSGVVDSISNTFEEKRGDITYTARIKLNESDPRLRWGMTTVVNFEK